MKKILILTLLLGNFIIGCQDSDSTLSPETDNTSPTQTPELSNSPEAKPSAETNNPVAAVPNNSPGTRQTCQISAYVIDQDPNGLNVRSGAGENYDIISKLPTTPIAVFIDITASQGNWVQITRAESPEKVEFQGTGWVYASLLGTMTRGYGTEGVSVYENANTESTAIGRIPPEKEVKLLGCDRAWVWVDYQELKGWIAPESQCPNPLTTCP